VLDLYTGCGTIAIHIAGKVNSVLGIELNRDAIKSAHENAELNNINNCEFIAGDVRKTMDALIAEDREFDTIIADPPRAGIGHKALVRICKLRARKIVYISCNPATLASDLKELEQNGYGLEETVPVDMFPHTFHIETVSRLTLK
jgi:23S rRNA (uracil1939-C5)-methyltransferase